jgi:hypothetical protein
LHVTYRLEKQLAWNRQQFCVQHKVHRFDAKEKRMKFYQYLVISVGIAVSCASCLIAEESDIAGTWRGAILVQPMEFEVGLEIRFEGNVNSDLRGKMVTLTHRRPERSLVDIAVTGKTITFLALEENQVVQFRGELSDDRSRISGTVVEGQQQAPFELIKNLPQLAETQAAQVLSLSSNLTEIKRIFNQDSNTVRLLIILSPQCSDCRVKAFLVQKYVLDAIESRDLRVYLVWERIGSDDSLSMAREAGCVMRDSRVRSFWSEDRNVGRMVKDLLQLPGEAAWNIFLMFPAKAVWSGDRPPQPAAFLHSMAPDSSLSQERTFNVRRLSADLMLLLDNLDKASPPKSGSHPVE